MVKLAQMKLVYFKFSGGTAIVKAATAAEAKSYLVEKHLELSDIELVSISPLEPKPEIVHISKATREPVPSSFTTIN